MRVRTHTNPLHFRDRLAKIDLKSIFNHYKGRLDLEIGFGRGLFLINYAKLNPQKCIIAVDVRKLIVDILKENLIKQNIANILPILSNAQICLEDLIDNASIENIFIFHPDPWFKKRHHKRRVITPDLLRLTTQKLTPNGKIFISTDVKELFDDITEKLTKFPELKPVEEPDFWDSIYKTHWQDFSIKNARLEYKLTLIFKK